MRRWDQRFSNRGPDRSGDPILELNKNILLNTLETNVFGPLFLCQACIPLMKKRGYGRIVNLASTLGSLNEMASSDSDTDIILSSAYRLSKTLLNGITLLLAREVRGAVSSWSSSHSFTWLYRIGRCAPAFRAG
ncbi:SDR family NAD(P)-dependent oxidoreductase [Desulfocicer niacini]